MEKYRKILLLSVKIGLGSSIAILIAQKLNLEYAVSAGTVTLLTLMTTKWETLKLSFSRFITFIITIAFAWQIFSYARYMWIAYGILLAIVVFIAESFGLRATISVNSVVAAHLVSNGDFTFPAIRNEFLLVLIGVITAIILNLFHSNITHQRQIIADMRDTENKLQEILTELAAYLSGNEMQEAVWNDIRALEGQIEGYTQSAREYQNNTFQSHPEYYISYFEMRHKQCHILQNLHNEMRMILSIPRQAAVIAEFLLYLADYVIEVNSPHRQVERLNEIFEEMKNEELPKTREEFEDRAILYHVLMDIQDFLMCKAEFVMNLDDKQLHLYWKSRSHVSAGKA